MTRKSSASADATPWTVHDSSLLLGYYQVGRLRHCGRVGTGFTRQSLADIEHRLDSLVTDEPPFEDPPSRGAARDVHWVRPGLVAEVEFHRWTDDGRLRQASFQGLRENKTPEEVVR